MHWAGDVVAVAVASRLQCISRKPSLYELLFETLRVVTIKRAVSEEIGNIREVLELVDCAIFLKLLPFPVGVYMCDIRHGVYNV